ncbi:MAG: DNA polymerase III subunit chi [Burkholderiales bacterium]|jgi:DNA polymerase-3 subunit chi|nr:DNA polymerase III subunit chi [Burkholderiales bacterium]MCA3154971.1 DNA polymerase III subunit chi [Burkholderiales bacterium]MCA3155972.1 DNA polymerase III subunit chi [Burkholderiales bacterium]MCA3159104.1 DNA polymerase III subunit chi [Burkholderiales bacterium]MCA3162541.1 DNA polymerase III subunit chi [Burkholderiales bacterium]
MTEIHFYTGLPDKVSYACNLVSKAVQRGKRVVVYSRNAELLKRFDQALWSSEPLSFVPHVMQNDALAAVTPVLLAATAPEQAEPLAHHEVLVNLDQELPKFFSRFDYLMELVEQDEQDSLAARERWKFYKQRGYSIEHHQKSGAQHG